VTPRVGVRIALVVTWAWAAMGPAPAVHAGGTFDADSARARARALAPHVWRAEPGPLWREFDGTMRGALNDSANFAAVLRTIVNSTGPLDSVLGEQVTTPRADVIVYTARCRCAKSTATLELIIAFDPTGAVSGLLVRPAAGEERKEYPSTHMDYQDRTVFRLPFRGEWTVFWGGRTLAQNYHAFTRDQRFAMDVLVVRDGRTHAGDGRRCEDYYCYGLPVLAPAAGTVVWAQDSLPDNAPGRMDPAHATGNSLVIDHGNGEYSLIAHLRPGTLRFKVGDRVPADAEVGRCGNSGNTTEPHVHMHLQNGPTPFDADGLPVQFVGLIVDGKRVDRAEIVKGQRVQRAE
jgi:hypothetical protein